MSDSEGTLYYVERILDHKIIRGKRYFFIKWIDFNESQNSWEPEENINPDLVIYYDTNFAEENDASRANLHRPAPKKRKVYVGEKRRKRRPGKGKTAEVKQEEIEVPEEPEYEDPIDHYMDDPVSDFLDQSINFDYASNDDIKPSTSRDYTEYEAACLSRAPTERIEEPVSNEPEPPPKPRVVSVDGYSRLQFKDKKLHMLVHFSDHPEAKFVPHDQFRYDYPQELIDFYESHTQWADRERFNP